MPTLPKKIILGIIILAIQLLRELKIPFPRILQMAAAILGVSRKSGYKAARQLRESLLAPSNSGQATLQRELVVLRIRNQILTYERDHTTVRFQRGCGHLPPEARSLCVRLLREFRHQLSQGEIADVIGIPYSNLHRWDREADAQCEFPSKEDLRGTHRRATPEDAREVCEQFQSLTESQPLEEFTQDYNEEHPEKPLDRKTITRILQSEDLRDIEPRESRPDYHGPFEVFFPGAQASLDGTKMQVVFPIEPSEAFTVVKEFAIDIATCAVLSDTLEKQETSEAVQRVVFKAREECAAILGILSDNGSANRSAGVKRVIESDAGAEHIFSFWYHPQTNGHMEGLFGQFSRIVGTIVLDDSSRESLAASVVEIIARVLVYFHNHSPRKRLDGLSPLEYLRNYSASEKEVETARAKLKERKKRSDALKRRHQRRDDPVFQVIVKRIVTLHRFDISAEDASRALDRYDIAIIESASRAFFIQSKRDGFDELKRTFAYFEGIARNKQKDLDADRLRTEAGFQKTARLRAQGEHHQRELLQEKKEEDATLRAHPERVVLHYADMLLRGSLRFLKEQSLQGLRRGLQALKKLGRATEATRDRLVATIGSWGQYSEELKSDLVKLFILEYDTL